MSAHKNKLLIYARILRTRVQTDGELGHTGRWGFDFFSCFSAISSLWTSAQWDTRDQVTSSASKDRKKIKIMHVKILSGLCSRPFDLLPVRSLSLYEKKMCFSCRPLIQFRILNSLPVISALLKNQTMRYTDSVQKLIIFKMLNSYFWIQI